MGAKQRIIQIEAELDQIREDAFKEVEPDDKVNVGILITRAKTTLEKLKRLF